MLRKSGGLRCLRVLGLLVGCGILAACSFDHDIPLDVSAAPVPAMQAGKVRTTLGVLYDDDFRGDVRKREVNSSHNYVFPVGAASVNYMDRVFPTLFESVIAVPSDLAQAGATGGPDLVIRPSVEEFQYAFPKMGSSEARVRISYKFDLTELDGAPVATWSVVGAADAPPVSLLSGYNTRDIADRVAREAMENAMRNFADGFTEVPEVRRWLRQAGILPGGASGELDPGAFTVSAVPFAGVDGQKAVFSADLSAAGFLAVEVTVANRDDRAALVRYGEMRLHGSGDIELLPRPTDDVMAATEGGDPGPFIGGMIGIVATMGVQGENYKKALNYESRKFHDAVLQPGEASSGVVYFHLPDGADMKPEALTLAARAVDTDSGEPIVVGGTRLAGDAGSEAAAAAAAAAAAGTGPGPRRTE